MKDDPRSHTDAIPKPQRRWWLWPRDVGRFLAATVLLGVIPASAEVTAIRIAKDETVSVGETAVRHVAGTISGKAERNEPGIPTLAKIVGLKYESDFELWIPVSGGNGRFWFSVLNRGNDIGGLRDGILRRGGGYGCVPGKPRTWPSQGRGLQAERLPTVRCRRLTGWWLCGISSPSSATAPPRPPCPTRRRERCIWHSPTESARVHGSYAPFFCTG